jgi:nitronate monooxygenase
MQRPSLPLFGPALLQRGMPDRLADATPLYAGESAIRIDSLVSAAEAVRLLAGVPTPPAAPVRSPTISGP